MLSVALAVAAAIVSAPPIQDPSPPDRAAMAASANRLTYLDGAGPYDVALGSPKLTTPQWVGEDGVDAVVVLAIDDLRDNVPKYEGYLRPILQRLKAIEGRAPLSIMTNRVDPREPPGRRLDRRGGLDRDAHPRPPLPPAPAGGTSTPPRPTTTAPST